MAAVNVIMSNIQHFAIMILVAIALVALLQTLLLQGKKKIVGGIATVIIIVFAIITATTGGTTIKGNPFDPAEMQNRQKQMNFKNEKAEESGIKRYCRLMTSFTNEMKHINKSIVELSEKKASSEFDAETLANKALSVKEKANKFFNRLQRSYRPQEANDIHKNFIAAAEHLRLAAFALHAEVSSDDKSFRDLQSAQQKEQLKLAEDQWKEVSETLSKLAPEFFNNQPKVK